jgi:hypothetical protein
MKYLAYLNILFGDNHMQTVETEKKGDALRITLVLKIGLRKFMSAKINKSKINKYKINNNNKANKKQEFNVKYERYEQDISKDKKLCLGKKL